MIWLHGDLVEKIVKQNGQVVGVGIVQRIFKDMIEVKFESEIVDLKLNKNKSINQHVVGLYTYNRK